MHLLNLKISARSGEFFFGPCDSFCQTVFAMSFVTGHSFTHGASEALIVRFWCTVNWLKLSVNCDLLVKANKEPLTYL